MPRRPTAGRVSQRTGFDPTCAPFAHGTIRRANGSSNLLVVLLRMGLRPQNDPRTYRQRLRRRVSTNKLLKMLSFFSRQFNWISGFGTTHKLSPPTLSLSSPVPAVKGGTDL